MPSHDNCYETAIRKFDDALKLTGNFYGPAYSNVIEGLQQIVQGLLEDRQMITERLAAIEGLLRNRYEKSFWLGPFVPDWGERKRTGITGTHPLSHNP